MEITKSDFIIEGSGGRRMAADVHCPETPGANTLVIYVHGINGFKDWGGMNLVAEKFAQTGFAFLKFNFSHNGTTPEDTVNFVDLEAYGNDNYSIRQEDLKRVLNFATHENQLGFEVGPIILLGHSRGGTDVILYTATDERVKSLITWAAPSEATTPWRKWDSEKLAAWKEEGVQYLENGRTGQQMPVYYQLYEDYKAHKRRFNLSDAARRIQVPWLICHGTDDEAVFVKDAYDLKEWQPGAQPFIIENTGHTFDRTEPWENQELPEASKKVVDRCISFLKEQT